MYLDFEKTKGKLETVLDTYQMKMEHHKKIKKRTTVCPLQLALHQCTLPVCLVISYVGRHAALMHCGNPVDSPEPRLQQETLFSSALCAGSC